jgi:imidazolonepropionase-like amidohydrolase
MISLSRLTAAAIVASSVSTPHGQESFPHLQPDDFIRVRGSAIALEHLRVIDGTGAAARADQTIVIVGDRIVQIGPSASTVVANDATRVDLTGRSALPGLVGMHDHLFYIVNQPDDGYLVHDMPFSYPRLYLAAGVTTIRTTGSYEPYTDLAIRRAIDAGTMIGPAMSVTGPYLEGEGFGQVQIHEGLGQLQIHTLAEPADARGLVDYWAAAGVDSFKVHAQITRAALKATIDAAHAHRLTVAGHLCSVGFREAAAMGIDSLEHGLIVDNEFDPAKQPDICPSGQGWPAAIDEEVDGPGIQRTIRALVEHHTAVTSTLPLFESYMASRPTAGARVLEALSDGEQQSYQLFRAQLVQAARTSGPTAEKAERLRRAFDKEMRFERGFVRAGGLLLAGPDGVQNGVIAGYGDHRELELLVEAGLTPLEAITVATANGAQFLRQDDRIGTLAAGKRADIAVVRGDPSTRIEDVEQVEIVFKAGVGYDSMKLRTSVRGQVGIR